MLFHIVFILELSNGLQISLVPSRLLLLKQEQHVHLTTSIVTICVCADACNIDIKCPVHLPMAKISTKKLLVSGNHELHRTNVVRGS